MKAENFDKIFDDDNEDITGYLDLNSAVRSANEQKRVNVDFPLWMIQSLDKEANRLGVPRQSIIKIAIAEHLNQTQRSKT